MTQSSGRRWRSRLSRRPDIRLVISTSPSTRLATCRSRPSTWPTASAPSLRGPAAVSPVYGISQGAVLPRMALTYWPSTQRLVSDAVLLAGPQHGVTPAACSDRCTAADWQLSAGSRLLRALNDGDETPGEVSYTTVRTRFDEVVQPVNGPHPTSALRGASNLVVQDVCPGRRTRHAALAVDSVSFAALLDAVGHQGSARPHRLSNGVGANPCATELPENRCAPRRHHCRPGPPGPPPPPQRFPPRPGPPAPRLSLRRGNRARATARTMPGPGDAGRTALPPRGKGR